MLTVSFIFFNADIKRNKKCYTKEQDLLYKIYILFSQNSSLFYNETGNTYFFTFKERLKTVVQNRKENASAHLCLSIYCSCNRINSMKVQGKIIFSNVEFHGNFNDDVD